MPEDWAKNDDGAAVPASIALSQKSFARLAEFITGELGIKMPDSKITMVQSRLMRRARELQLCSVDDYGEYFFTSSNCEEREHFINAITTNKTDFFREPEHFEFLVRTALPNLCAGVDRRISRLNVWSAGCSSGQEPYTLGMVLSEYALQNPRLQFRDPGHRHLDQSAGTSPASDLRGDADQAGSERLTRKIPAAQQRSVRVSGEGLLSAEGKGHISSAQLHERKLSHSGHVRHRLLPQRLIYFDRRRRSRSSARSAGISIPVAISSSATRSRYPEWIFLYVRCTPPSSACRCRARI